MHIKEFGKTVLMTAVALIVINQAKKYAPSSVKNLLG